MKQHDMAAGELALDVALTQRKARARPFAIATPVLRIATFHSGSLSGLVASLPALLAMRESFPGAHISSFARSSHVSLLAHFRACDEVHARPGGGVAGQAALMARLHAGDFDLAVSFSPAANAMLLLWSTRAARRAGFVPSPFEAFLTHRVSRRGPLRASDALDLVAEVGAHPRGERVAEALEVPQGTFDSVRERLPFEPGQFVLCPFDGDPPRAQKDGGDWTQALAQLRAHWPVVVAAPRASGWKEVVAHGAPHGAFLWPAPNALTLLALLRASRAVVGPGGAAMELAFLDERRLVRPLRAEDALGETLRVLGL